MSALDLLPDCRAQVTRNRVFRFDGAWVPFFCGNCGKEGGLCPEENMTFMFYLCNECFKTHGEIAGTMAVPDKVFYDKLHQEQLEAHGRPLSSTELLQVIADDSSPLATLLKEAK